MYLSVVFIDFTSIRKITGMGMAEKTMEESFVAAESILRPSWRIGADSPAAFQKG